MSMRDYEKALRLIEGSDKAYFSGPKPEEWVGKAEAALGLKFPPTYRRFLREFGCGGVASEEFYGIVDDNFETGPVPDGIWLTLRNRREFGLPHNFILVNDLGEGSRYAIDTSRVGDDGENPVVILAIGYEVFEDVAPSFGTFFYEQIEKEVTAED